MNVTEHGQQLLWRWHGSCVSAFPVPGCECLDFLFKTFDQVPKAGVSHHWNLFIQANLVLFSVYRWLFWWVWKGAFRLCVCVCGLVWQCGGVWDHWVHVYSTCFSTCLIGGDCLVLTCTGMKTNAAELWEKLSKPGCVEAEETLFWSQTGTLKRTKSPLIM